MVLVIFALSDERLRGCFRRSTFLMGAVVGCISALPLEFAERFDQYLHLGANPFLFYFSLWQALVGTYLYAIYTKANRKTAQS